MDIFGRVFAELADVMLVLAVAGPSLAQPAAAHQTVADSVAVESAHARIKAIDIQHGSVTLEHDALPRLGMPDMTMVFRVARPGQLADMQVGAAVTFRLEKVNGTFVITEIRRLK